MLLSGMTRLKHKIQEGEQMKSEKPEGRKQVAITTEDIGNRVVRFCISNEEEDRDGDTLIATGCDFTNFAKNPQFLGMHNKWDFPLGKPIKWWADARLGKVYADVYFPTIAELAEKPEYASEKAKLVDFTYYCYKTGMLSAVSVGFIPKTWTVKENADQGGYIITKWELLEFSAVPVPANQSALAEAVKSYDPDGTMGKYFPIKKSEPEPDITEKTGAVISKKTGKALDEIRGSCAIMKSEMEKINALVAGLLTKEDEEDVLAEEDVLEIEE